MSTLTTPNAKRLLGAGAPGSRIAAELHRRVTSYNASKIAGTNDYDGILGVYLGMKNPEPPALSPAQVGAADATPRLMRRYLADNPGLTAHRVGILLSRTHDWLAARPTALTSDGGALIITTTRDDLGDPWYVATGPERHRMPAWMKTRVVHDLMVTGVSHVTVLCEIQGRKSSTILVRRIGRHERGIKKAMRDLFALEQRFHVRQLLGDEPPTPNVGDQDLLDERHRSSDPDLTMQATAEQMRDLHHMVELQVQACELERDIGQIKARLKNAMGSAHTLYSPRGTKLVSWATTQGFAYERFSQDFPLIAAQHRVRVEALDVPGVTTAHPDITKPYWVRPFTRNRAGRAMAELLLQATG